jgi:hypothetical protein
MRTPFQSYDRLKAAGMPEAQARSIVEAIEDHADFSFKELATKADLRAETAEIRAEIADLKVQLNTQINDLKEEMHARTNSLRQEIHALTSSLREEMHALTNSLREEMHALINSLREEMHIELKSIRSEIAQLDIKFSTLFAGLQSSIHSLQKLFYSGFAVIIAGMVLSYFHH